MGDFYELFFGDAAKWRAGALWASSLTKRGKRFAARRSRCAGVPVERGRRPTSPPPDHAWASPRGRVRAGGGSRPRRRSAAARAVVRRDVVRVVTPGTLTEDGLLDARRNNYLVAIARAKLSADGDSAFALAFLDISTGEFRLTECDRTGLSGRARAARARRDHRVRCALRRRRCGGAASDLAGDAARARRRMRSGRSVRAFAIPSSPFRASVTEKPKWRRIVE